MTLTLLAYGSPDFFPIRAEPRRVGDVFLATGAQNPPSASLTRQSRFDPRSPQAAGHFFLSLRPNFCRGLLSLRFARGDGPMVPHYA